MRRFADWIQAVALSLGAPGLFIVAFLDSSFLSLPEINDLLLVLMVTQHKSRMVLYATSATLGSIAGCLALYYLGRKGGDAFVRRRFSAATVDRAIGTFQTLRRDGDPHPLAAPAAGAVQDFRPAGRCRGHQRRRVSSRRSPSAAGSGTSAKACWPSGTATRPSRSFTRTPPRSRLILVGLLVAGLVAYVVWRKARARKGP